MVAVGRSNFITSRTTPNRLAPTRLIRKESGRHDDHRTSLRASGQRQTGNAGQMGTIEAATIVARVYRGHGNRQPIDTCHRFHTTLTPCPAS